MTILGGTWLLDARSHRHSQHWGNTFRAVDGTYGVNDATNATSALPELLRTR